MGGCDRLQFAPEVRVKPDGQAASTPTGLTVDVHVPQEINANGSGLASSDVKNITVTLPAGVVLNPSSADGLQACSEGLVGFEATGGASGDGYEEYLPGVRTPLFTPTLPGHTSAEVAGETAPFQPGVNFCPDQAKVANVTIKSPLLPASQPLTGAVYLASPQNFRLFPQENPFGSLLALYIVAEDPISGTVVKLPGRVELGGEPGVEGLAPGQIRGVFEDNPQLAFEDAEIHFFGGERAPLATPARCGTYTTNASFTPWSRHRDGAASSPSCQFAVDFRDHQRPERRTSVPERACRSARR